MAIKSEQELVRKHLEQAHSAAKRFGMLASHNVRSDASVERFRQDGNARMLLIIAAEERLERGLYEARRALIDLRKAEELRG